MAPSNLVDHSVCVYVYSRFCIDRLAATLLESGVLLILVTMPTLMADLHLEITTDKVHQAATTMRHGNKPLLARYSMWLQTCHQVRLC